MIGAGEHHAAALDAAVEQQELAAVRDPALMPHAPAGVVGAEALADETVALHVHLAQRAAA